MNYEIDKKILVLATMSAGKSTLINALIGNDVFPSSNEACTAKIITYTSDNTIENIKAKAYGKENIEYENLELKDIETINSNKDFNRIELYGPINNNLCKNINVTFIDTPGVNNSQDTSHKDITYNALEKEDFDTILYVLNATQLGTNDDALLLAKLKEYINKNTNKDIIFVLNKIDEIDTETEIESIEDLYENAIQYIFKNTDIKDPKIVCLSSYYANLIKKKKNSIYLTRIEKDNLDDYIETIEYDNLNIKNLNNLSNSNNTILDNEDKLLNEIGFYNLERYLFYRKGSSTEVLLKYNPYKVETNITIDGEEITEDSYLYKYKNERLQVWVENLIPQIINQLNESDFKLVFKGTNLDYDDVLYYCDYYNKNGYNGDKVNIKLEHIKAKDSAHKIKQLQELVNDMKKGPFEELKSEQIEESFNKAINSEFEIAVMATMSSGKSTLINSILSKELMPSKNQACTAKITRIKDNDNMEGFTAECKNSDNEVILTMEDVDLDNMKEFNDDNKISLIDIEGNIPNISSEDMKLVLIDTPGPNNAQDMLHKEFAFRVIKNQTSKPMILYVLNATQLGTNDDNSFLAQVAEAMKVGGKQSKDRFIFAVNKIDKFDPEKENIGLILNNVKSYLESHGIENPNVYPVSAELAKLIRLDKNGYDLTLKQKRNLRGYKTFLDEEDLHTLKYTPLSNNTKNYLQEKIDTCNDVYEKALYHTGIPYIETSINTYLEKYAVTSKITSAVNSFKKIIDEKQMLQEIEDSIKENKEYREAIKKEVYYIRKQIKMGNGGKKVQKEIDKLTFNKKEATKPIRQKINIISAEFSDKFRNKEIEKSEAEPMINNMLEKMKTLELDVNIDLEHMVDAAVKLKAEEYIEKYRKQVEGLMKIEGKFKVNSIKYLSYSIPDVEDLINNSTYIKSEKVGEEKYVNPNKKWYNPFTWFDPDYLTRDVYEDKSYIDGNVLSEEVIYPYLKSLNKNVENAEKATEKAIKELKGKFTEYIDELDEVLESKLKELEGLLDEDKDINNDIKNKEKERNWLLKINKKINNIIEI